MAKVEVYIKFMCPFCARAMKLLKSKGVEIDEIDITMGGQKRTEMLARSEGRTTVPQIFIDGKAIGGSDDLAALESRGQLEPLLA